MGTALFLRGSQGVILENLGLAIEAAAAGLGTAIAIESLLDHDLAQLNLVRWDPLIKSLVLFNMIQGLSCKRHVVPGYIAQ